MVNDAHIVLLAVLVAEDVEHVVGHQILHVLLLAAHGVGGQLPGLVDVAAQLQIGGLHLVGAHGDGGDLGGLVVDLDLHLDGIGHGTVLDGHFLGFLLDLTDVLGGGVGDDTLHHVPDHGQGHTDGGNDLGVLGQGVTHIQLLGGVGK